ncbi:MAG TPA: PEP/pyruvate-binding domain-containing protein [Anaerovoracaceae bacterium]|nr:PEP/pyruvate-binding domain-containing protein [Anaerovoracaceae bacterium]
MSNINPNIGTKEYDPKFTRFHDLMQYRVREILLVSTPYDSFVLEEDGHLSDKIFSEYLDLNLQFVPRIAHASSAEEAFEALKSRTYDLVITMPRISDMSPLEFSRRVKEAYPEKPVVMLTYETLDEETLSGIREAKSIDRVFVWSGNSQILLAIIKYVEDRGNVEEDSEQGVQVVLVVDDSPGYYSQFLPLIYTEIMKQTRYLISHAVNDFHRLLRMRARPKILLAESYEEAMEFIDKYKNNLLGIISDVSFLKDGSVNDEAGLELAAAVRDQSPDIPILLQSQETKNIEKAKKLGMSCLDKNSPDLLKDLRNYILDSYNFGEFVFKSSRGVVISSVSDISSFERAIKVLPEDSLAYHAAHNHFSRWFRARTEFEVADELREREGSAPENLKKFREFMEDCIDRIFKRYQKGVILDFGLSKMDFENSFIRLGGGSLGGKARGVAFFRTLVTDSDLQKKYPDVKMKIPRSFVICSDVFEEFLHMNDLQEMAVKSSNEDEIAQRFLAARLPDVITDNLRVMINEINYPLAVRSSSILEDSQVLPFAGIFKTYLLPNCDPNPVVRYKQLVDAVKLIYASAFFQSPKGYAKNADIRIEEGSMSVLIQQLVGEAHGDLFYPVISGVAQTWNYYPYSHMKPEQGIISLALGFGKVIVDGGRVYSFSPAYPKMNPPYASPREFMDNTQTTFYTLNLGESAKQLTKNDECTYNVVGLSRVEEDQTLQMVASTYLADNDLIMDTFNATGPKIVTFANILKHKSFPLVDIVKDLFEMGKSAFGTDVEIEFAVNLPVDKEKTPEFYFLQIRPMVVGREARECKIEEYSEEDVVCTSAHIIGNGAYKDITDVIYIDPERFDLSKTNAISSEIGELNKILVDEGRKCILMGFGRLGTSDPWLGIPLVWWQMSQAKVVVEADLDNLVVEPSLGSHFHHNLTSLKMGYFHISKKTSKEEYINWDNLRQAPVVRETAHVKLVRFKKPLVIKIDGQCNQGVILKQD